MYRQRVSQAPPGEENGNHIINNVHCPMCQRGLKVTTGFGRDEEKVVF